MSTEIFWLFATLSVTVFMAFPYVLDRIAVRGLFTAMGNPSEQDKPLHAWANRAQRAHTNAIENLVVFAPLVLIVESVKLNSEVTAAACAAFFFARVFHYIVYVIGIPVVRTLLFFVGWGATIALVLAMGEVL